MKRTIKASLLIGCLLLSLTLIPLAPRVDSSESTSKVQIQSNDTIETHIEN